jgi:hypothetical protein
MAGLFIHLLFIASACVYIGGFAWLSILLGVPMDWPPALTGFWIGMVLVCNLILILFAGVRFLANQEPADWADIIRCTARGMAKMASVFLLLPLPIVAGVSGVTYAILYLLLPIAMNIGLPIKCDRPTISMLCPFIALPQFFAAFAVLLWVLYPPHRKKQNTEVISN